MVYSDTDSITNANYVKYDIDRLKEELLYHKVVKLRSRELVLDDGRVLKIKLLDSDCCAYGDGEFVRGMLDAVITDVKLECIKSHEDDNELIKEAVLMIYNNMNPVAQALLQCDNGNGGYYYSVLGVTLDGDPFSLIDTFTEDAVPSECKS